MTRRKRAETESFTVSFLDVASCGFGAMIILGIALNHLITRYETHLIAKEAVFARFDRKPAEPNNPVSPKR